MSYCICIHKLLYNKDMFLGTFGQDQTWTLGDPSTYLHPMIPEDVLLDKDGLEALLEQSTLTFTAYPEHTKLAETPVKEKVQEFSETQPEDTMAVTDVGTDVSQFFAVEWQYYSACYIRRKPS